MEPRNKRATRVPSIGCVGKPLPFRDSSGQTVVDPMDMLRSQYLTQQVQSAQSHSYNAAASGNSVAVRNDCLTGPTTPCTGPGTNQRGFPYGNTLLDGPMGNSCRRIRGRDDSACPTSCSGGGRTNNLLIPQSTFYNINSSTQYSTIALFSVNDSCNGDSFAAPGPCGQRTGSTVVGGPGWRNQ